MERLIEVNPSNSFHSLHEESYHHLPARDGISVSGTIEALSHEYHLGELNFAD